MINPIFSICVKILSNRCINKLIYLDGSYPNIFSEEENIAEINGIINSCKSILKYYYK